MLGGQGVLVAGREMLVADGTGCQWRSMKGEHSIYGSSQERTELMALIDERVRYASSVPYESIF